MTESELQNLEKWKMLSALSGINVNDLFDSDDDQASEVFECLERIEDHERMIANNAVPYKVAQQALNLGLTTDKIWAFHSYQAELEAQAEIARLVEEERVNPRLTKLRDKHKMQITSGKSPHQTYWTFEADLGDGVRTYNCRLVITSWFNQRIWREWKDSSGKNQKEKLEFGGMNAFYMDNKWPAKWQQQYARNFTSIQLPYAYTNDVISKSKVNKPSKKKGVKTV